MRITRSIGGRIAGGFGIVLVLLLGEIDLSVGSMSGLAAAIMAVQVVNNGQSMLVGVIAGIAAGVIVGGVMALRFG